MLLNNISIFPFFDWLIEATGFWGWLIGVVAAILLALCCRQLSYRKNKKKYQEKSIPFKKIKETGIIPIAHGEPFWKIISNDEKDINNRFLIIPDSNDKDKSKDNIYVVDKIKSERIGENEEPKQIVKMVKINPSENNTQKKRFGIKAVVLIREDEINKVLMRGSNRFDATFESLIETKDFGSSNPIFSCVQRGWNQATKNSMGNQDDFILTADKIKYGDLYTDENNIWLTAYIIFEEPASRTIKKLFMSEKNKLTKVAMIDDKKTILEDDEITIKSLLEMADGVTAAGNYNLLMLYARIINRTLLG